MGVKFYKTTSPKISSIAVENGNLIFCEDTRTVYLDNATERVAYQQIMILQTDAQRQAMTQLLVDGFYFVNETNILWRLENHIWIQITEKPSEQLYYGTLSTFPRPGKRQIIYYSDTAMYHWDEDTQSYQTYSGGNPQWIVEVTH